MPIALHSMDIDRETVDVNTVLDGLELTVEQRLGVEAVAALKADLYCDPHRPHDEQLQESRRWDVMSCLLGVNWKDPELIEGLADGVPRDRLMRMAEEDRNRLLKQAERIGVSVRAHLMRLGISLP